MKNYGILFSSPVRYVLHLHSAQLSRKQFDMIRENADMSYGPHKLGEEEMAQTWNNLKKTTKQLSKNSFTATAYLPRYAAPAANVENGLPAVRLHFRELQTSFGHVGLNRDHTRISAIFSCLGSIVKQLGRFYVLGARHR